MNGMPLLCYTWLSRAKLRRRGLKVLKSRSFLSVSVYLCLSFVVSLALSSCGSNYYFAGRTLPPSGVLNRVLIAVQNPSALTKGALAFVDAYYDIRHPYKASSGSFSISGYSASLPATIQNLPEQQVGAVYGKGDGSFTLISYAQEKVSSSVTIPGGFSSSVFISRDLGFAYAANQTAHLLSVVDRTKGTSLTLSLPGAYGISVNPGGTVVLVFIQNSNSVYSIVHLTAEQQTAAANNPTYNGAADCEPQNLPSYCVFPVKTSGSATFDRPTKAVFSPDGSTAYVINCGPECGGTTSGFTTIPITADSLNTGVTGAAGINLTTASTVAIAGGATNAIFNSNTLYLAGQQLQSSGLFAGFLTVYNTGTQSISGTYSISDGTHNKMVFGDDNTLWIGSAGCQAGVRYQAAQNGGSTQYGCLTMFNTSTNAVTVDAYKGDATGIAAVTGLNKVYTAEGGQVYIYKTADMSQLDNSNVTVQGTASDVAYMDAASDGDNTTY